MRRFDFWPFSGSAKPAKPTTSSHAPAIDFERSGEQTLDSVARAARRVRWTETVLQLAWTAGPVTIIAMQIGYWIGFGNLPPLENLFFFVAYTVIAGFISLLTRLIVEWRTMGQRRSARSALTEVSDRLPDLVFAVRDLYLMTLEERQRRIEAARLILTEVDLGQRSVAIAVEQITEDPELARCAETLDIYRRAGLFSRVRELAENCRKRAADVLHALHASNPEAAALLRERLNGRAPDPREGRPRRENFLERILSGIAADNLSLFGLRDVEELLVLTFELMMGRELLILSFRPHASGRLVHTSEQVEYERNRYQIARAGCYERLQTLADHLAEHDDGHSPPAGEVKATLHKTIESRINQLIREVRVQGTTVAVGGIAQSPRFSSAWRQLDDAVLLYRLAEGACRTARARHLRFQRALKRWQKAAAEEPAALGNDEAHGDGTITILERRIRLEDAQKVRIATNLTRTFEAQGLAAEAGRIQIGRGRTRHPIQGVEAKRLAVTLTEVLEPEIGLSREDVQRAVTHSKAAHLSPIDLTVSGTIKAGWGESLVNELRDDTGKLAERLALSLTQLYRIPLNEGLIQTLQERYGANEERLRMLAARGQAHESRPSYEIGRPDTNLTVPDRLKPRFEVARRTVERYRPYAVNGSRSAA